jgi:hypothetical protein
MVTGKEFEEGESRFSGQRINAGVTVKDSAKTSSIYTPMNWNNNSEHQDPGELSSCASKEPSPSKNFAN